jgi:hypothetical protein
LCCSTWLTEFKSVNTAAARYQNLAINQTKLSGMCGRLKCCLNYELDTYIDALEDFPDRAERLKTQAGLAILVKTDVFKRIMFYTYAEDRGKFFAIHVDQIWEALDMIKSGKLPASLDDILAMAPQAAEEEHDEAEPDFENVHDVIQLPMEKRKKKKKKKKNREGSAAAAVEKAAAQDEAAQRGPSHGRPSGDRRDQRRPDQRAQGRPDQRPQGRPDQKQQERPPQKPPQGQGGGGQNQGQRPPQQGKPDSRNQDRPPQNKPDQRPPQERPPNQQGGNNKKQGPPRPPQQDKPDQNNK